MISSPTDIACPSNCGGPDQPWTRERPLGEGPLFVGGWVDRAFRLWNYYSVIEIDREKLAGAVRFARGKRTMLEVAQPLGMSASTFCRVERGSGLPSADGLLRLAVWMDRDPRDFARAVSA